MSDTEPAGQDAELEAKFPDLPLVNLVLDENDEPTAYQGLDELLEERARPL